MTHALSQPVPRFSAGRLASLDGLRGLAAVVVVIHHSLLTIPSMANAYFPQFGRAEPFSISWILTYTPAHLIWAGTEAVYLFFVLSGVVLVVQALKSPRISTWLAYYPRRAVRLYLPIWAAIVFAYITIQLVHRDGFAEQGPWLGSRPSAYGGTEIKLDMVLLNGPSYVISPFWSLRWELLFSLFLPIFVALAAYGHRYLFYPKMALALGLVVYGSVAQDEFWFFMPMFGVGAVLAAHWSWLGTGLSKVPQWAWAVIFVVAAIGTSSRWYILGVSADLGPIADHLTWIPLIAVTLVLLCAAYWLPFKRLLEMRLFLWLGKISFSLYLVHEPIVIASRYLFNTGSPIFAITVAIPVAFFVATLFSRMVEQPAHRLSQKVGKLLVPSTRAAAHAAPPVAATPRARAQLQLEAPKAFAMPAAERVAEVPLATAPSEAALDSDSPIPFDELLATGAPEPDELEVETAGAEQPLEPASERAPERTPEPAQEPKVEQS